METTDNEKLVPPENGSEISETSADKAWDGEKYPAWQKSIGKEYWGNEKLKDFATMKDVIESIVNPKKKAPEKYEGVADEVVEALRSADISQEDAKKISDAYSKLIPKKHSLESLKENYGADWEAVEKDFDKALNKIVGDEKTRKALKELEANPYVFEFARLVGMNLGDDPKLDIGKQNVHKKGTGDPIMDAILRGK